MASIHKEIPLPAPAADVWDAVRDFGALHTRLVPGFVLDTKLDGEARIVIPEKLRVGHEDHFGQVTNLFFDYLKKPTSMRAWELSNMMVKYFITTSGNE